MSYDPSLTQSTEGLANLPVRLARRLFLDKLDACERGELRVRDSYGSRTVGTGNRIVAELTVREPAFYPRVVLGGSVAFGESYRDGTWTSSDLTTLLEFFTLNREALQGGIEYLNVLKPLRKLYHWSKKNTREGSEENIEAHYDIGNDFYQLFLDETMTYSSAYFTEQTETLADAQREKYRRLSERLDIKPDDRVLEIGTGWGGFVQFLGEQYNCQITTTTISEEQYNWTKNRVSGTSFEDRVTVLKEDYRELSGTYDGIVSVEMLEAVGEEYLPVFFNRLGELLEPDGQAALQTIHIRDQFYDFYRKNVDFIQRYIFPGGHLPSIGKVQEVLSGTNLAVTGLEETGNHYVETLEQWKHSLLNNADEVRELGYDDEFLRLWEYYFCYCQAGFKTGLIGNFQITLEKPELLKETT